MKAQSPWKDAASACTRKRTDMRDANLYEHKSHRAPRWGDMRIEVGLRERETRSNP